MRRPAVLAVILLAVPALSGCVALEDLWDRITAPDATVQVTPILEGGEPGTGPWNDDRFLVRVIYEEPLAVSISAESLDGRRLVAAARPFDAELNEAGLFENELVLLLDDGIWDIEYRIDDRKWGTYDLVHVDTTAPEIEGLRAVGDAVGGRFSIGASARVDPDAAVAVHKQGQAAPIGTRLPHVVEGLGDGVHVYDVVARDPAGNQNVYTVQVRAGDAKALPEGKFTAGIVARYTNELRLWDISDPSRYLSPADAARQINSGFLGPGFGITPEEPTVRAIVNDVTAPGMTTLEVAVALYRELYDRVDYDRARLEAEGLLLPRETLQAQGGVCRDLAALYTSMLRAAGVPARLVTGYLGGDDPLGFHAWVEFYAPSDIAGQSAWIPVDVSPVDGAFDDPYRTPTNADPDPPAQGTMTMLQAFGIKNPEYLQLRTVPESAEEDGWSTAVAYRTEYHGRAPDIDFATEVMTSGVIVERTLCVHPETLRRTVSTTGGDGCEAGAFFLADYPIFIEQIIDYGVQIDSGAADVALEAAYPFAADAAPDRVEFISYGPAAWTGIDSGSDRDGKLRVEFRH